MSKGSYHIRSMAEKEARISVDWAEAEGWNPGLNDAQLFYDTDRQGFLAGFLDGQPVATISAVRYGSRFAFVGFYIVKPGFRGQGYGWRLWQAAMEQLSGRNIGLDGVEAQQENYKKSGFKFAYRNIRFKGQITDAPGVNAALVDLCSIPFELVLTYDSEHFFEPRPDFLARWIVQPSCRALGYMENGRLKGFGVIRRCSAGYKIGPLFADSAQIAEQLLVALAPHADGQAVYLDVPEPNSAGISLAGSLGLTPVFNTARMYTGDVPPINQSQVFGVTSFELG